MAVFKLFRTRPDRDQPRLSRPRNSARHSSQRGIAAVEFAMMLPVLLLFVLGAVEVADVFYFQKELVGAAQSAARTGATQTSTVAQVQSALTTYLSNTRVGTSYTSTITGVGSGATGDTLVTVTVNYNFPLFTKVPALGWSGTTIPLSASVTLRHE